MKLHIDLHLRHFRQTLIVANDDFTGSNAIQTSPAMDYALEKGLGWRDDSIMVDKIFWFHERQAAGFWPKRPVVIEPGHYHVVKQRGFWSGETMLASLEAHHASYYSIHGDPKEFLDENREAVDAANRRLGYRFQARRIVYPSRIKVAADPEKALPFKVSFSFANAGVAPCYRSVFPCLTLKTASGGIAMVLADGDFDLSRLPVAPPGKADALTHTAEFSVGRWRRPVLPPGEYEVFLSVGEEDGTPVCELPLPGDDGARRYRIGRMQVD